MTTLPRILVAIATYNEIDSLPQLVVGIRQYAPDVDLLVIDDNSPDGTGAWCEEQATMDARWHVLRRPGKLGLGSATVAALRFAITNRYDLVVTMDADLSHDPCYLPTILATIQDPTEPVDVVIGSRYVTGGGIVGWPWYRLLMSRFINWYARRMLALRPLDCSGAYRCFRVELLRSLDFDSVLSRGYSLLEEILWMLQRRGARLREVPITFVDRARGHSKISYREACASLLILFQLWLRR